jgi:hypothetical protein
LRILLAALVLLATPCLAPASAQAAGQRAAPAPRPEPLSEAGSLCLPAIEAAERAEQIPAGLLRSIAHVESARPDPVSGRYVPWPWTINAEGEGRYFETKQAALDATRALIAAGMRSIDVGCAQVNLLHHPQAFASLEQAFDPSANATYAARFLKSLRVATGSWPFAAAGYHSMTPERGHAYAGRVAAIWPAAAEHGPWPLAPADLVLAAPGMVAPVAPQRDYSIYTPAHAARLRRQDTERDRQQASAVIAPRRGRPDRLPPAPVIMLRAPQPIVQPLARSRVTPTATGPARTAALGSRGGT